MKNTAVKNWSLLGFLVAVVMLLPACSVHEIQKTSPFTSKGPWIILPLVNHSDSPEAGERVADIAATLLRSQHRIDLRATRIPDNAQALPELNPQKAVDAAIQWGKEQHYRYGLGGSVQEWRYKSGLDGEPAVGLTLNVINLSTGQVMWSASGAKTGWGRESVSGTGHKLTEELLDGLPLAD